MDFSKDAHSHGQELEQNKSVNDDKRNIDTGDIPKREESRMSLEILVYDSIMPEFRHTALLITTWEHGTKVKNGIFQITGASPFFAFDQSWVNDGSLVASEELLAKIPVATVEVQPSEFSQLQGLISGTPIKINLGDWNCQNWVGDALERLLEGSFLSEDSVSRSLDEMAEVIISGERR